MRKYHFGEDAEEVRAGLRGAHVGDIWQASYSAVMSMGEGDPTMRKAANMRVRSKTRSKKMGGQTIIRFDAVDDEGNIINKKFPLVAYVKDNPSEANPSGVTYGVGGLAVNVEWGGRKMRLIDSKNNLRATARNKYVAELGEEQQQRIQAALEEHFKMTAPDRLTFSDNGFTYRLNPEESRQNKDGTGYWIYELSDNSPDAPKNLDEMRMFEDTAIEVNLDMLMHPDENGLDDYEWDAVKLGMASRLVDLDDVIDWEDVLFKARNVSEARAIGGRRYFRSRVHWDEIENKAIERFMKQTTEPYADYTWDGKELIVLDSGGNVLEKYSRQSLMFAGILPSAMTRGYRRSVRKDGKEVGMNGLSQDDLRLASWGEIDMNSPSQDEMIGGAINFAEKQIEEYIDEGRFESREVYVFDSKGKIIDSNHPEYTDDMDPTGFTEEGRELFESLYSAGLGIFSSQAPEIIDPVSAKFLRTLMDEVDYGYDDDDSGALKVYYDKDDEGKPVSDLTEYMFVKEDNPSETVTVLVDETSPRFDGLSDSDKAKLMEEALYQELKVEDGYYLDDVAEPRINYGELNIWESINSPDDAANNFLKLRPKTTRGRRRLMNTMDAVDNSFTQEIASFIDDVAPKDSVANRYAARSVQVALMKEAMARGATLQDAFAATQGKFWRKEGLRPRVQRRLQNALGVEFSYKNNYGKGAHGRFRNIVSRQGGMLRRRRYNYIGSSQNKNQVVRVADRMRKNGFYARVIPLAQNQNGLYVNLGQRK